RPAWRAANYASFDALLAPVVAGAGKNLGPLSGPAGLGAGAVLGAEVGALTGLLGRRVLGQVDVRLLDPEAPLRLLLVVPNLHASAKALDVDAAQLVRWVTVHEVTHAVQFTGVPWLRPYLGELIGELLELAQPKDKKHGGAPRPAVPKLDVRALVEQARSGSLLTLVAGPERAALLERIQSIMSLIEGHAEHVMDAAGAPVLPDLDQLRAALKARRETATGFSPWKLLEKLLGMELKMKQYAVGKAFCDEVVARSDVPTLHRAFAARELVPTAAELKDAGAWIARVSA
ncbi:MAG: hypothetical protein JWM31_2789, partial [Solirubrobacterales bacterium]|nr:hypothetical protein [Solirubrobacterales bacterium]